MKSLRILLVDDNALLGALLADVLEGMGHFVCGLEATEAGAVQTALATRRPFDKFVQSPAAVPNIERKHPIRPAISWPGIIGSIGSGKSPSTTCKSVRQTPQAPTVTRISPRSGLAVLPLGQHQGRPQPV